MPVKSPVSVPVQKCESLPRRHCQSVPVKRPRVVNKSVPRTVCESGGAGGGGGGGEGYGGGYGGGGASGGYDDHRRNDDTRLKTEESSRNGKNYTQEKRSSVENEIDNGIGENNFKFDVNTWIERLNDFNRKAKGQY